MPSSGQQMVDKQGRPQGEDGDQAKGSYGNIPHGRRLTELLDLTNALAGLGRPGALDVANPVRLHGIGLVGNDHARFADAALNYPGHWTTPMHPSLYRVTTE